MSTMKTISSSSSSSAACGGAGGSIAVDEDVDTGGTGGGAGGIRRVRRSARSASVSANDPTEEAPSSVLADRRCRAFAAATTAAMPSLAALDAGRDDYGPRLVAADDAGPPLAVDAGPLDAGPESQPSFVRSFAFAARSKERTSSPPSAGSRPRSARGDDASSAIGEPSHEPR